MRKLIISLAASAVITAGAVAGLQASSQASTDGNGLQATFTTSPVSVTPNLGMVELILSGTGTVEEFGAATEVVGLVQDHTVTPCGAGSYSDTVSRRVVTHGGVLVTHEMGMTCVTASGLQASGTYQVDGRASTGIFAGARGTGDVTVDVATHRETLSGKLILAPAAA